MALSHIRTRPPDAGAIQAQALSKQPGGDHEREADHVGKQFTRVPEPLLQRACPCGGGCPRCRAEHPVHEREPSQMQFHDDVRQAMQAKLVVGKPGDIYEQEADEVATTIMRMPDPQVVEEHAHTAMPAIATRHNGLSSNNALRRQPTDFVFEIPEEEEFLQPKAASGHSTEVAPGFEGQLDTIEGRAQPFPPSLRAFFEPRFGYDLGPVRVHTGDWADRMARSVHARAFTLGRHIVFGAGYYAPATSEGQHLLAHELTHTIQQGAVTQRTASSHSSSTASPTGTEVSGPSVRAPSTPQFMLQKAACNFYVHDSTEPTKLGWAWKWAAHSLAQTTYGGYRVPSGDSIEGMLHHILTVYAEEGCDCIEEIQFLSHGSPGNAMFISKSKEELTIKDFNIPELEKYGDGPRDTPGYRAWHDRLTPRQRRLVLLRRVLCGPGAEVYYRSCQAFQGKTGQEFAKASAAFWRAKVIGHTKIIALTQPGQKVLKPGQEPYWSESEGTEQPSAKKPVGIGATQKPKKD